MTPSFDSTGKRLCTAQPMVRVRVRRNGDEFGPEYMCRGHTMEQLLDYASAQLGCVVKKLFADGGAAITMGSSVQRDQLLWASCGEAYIDCKLLKEKVLKKAFGFREQQPSPLIFDI